MTTVAPTTRGRPSTHAAAIHTGGSSGSASRRSGSDSVATDDTASKSNSSLRSYPIHPSLPAAAVYAFQFPTISSFPSTPTTSQPHHGLLHSTPATAPSSPSSSHQLLIEFPPATSSPPISPHIFTLNKTSQAHTATATSSSSSSSELAPPPGYSDVLLIWNQDRQAYLLEPVHSTWSLRYEKTRKTLSARAAEVLGLNGRFQSVKGGQPPPLAATPAAVGGPVKRRRLSRLGASVEEGREGSASSIKAARSGSGVGLGLSLSLPSRSLPKQRERQGQHSLSDHPVNLQAHSPYQSKERPTTASTMAVPATHLSPDPLHDVGQVVSNDDDDDQEASRALELEFEAAMQSDLPTADKDVDVDADIRAGATATAVAVAVSPPLPLLPMAVETVTPRPPLIAPQPNAADSTMPTTTTTATPEDITSRSATPAATAGLLSSSSSTPRIGTGSSANVNTSTPRWRSSPWQPSSYSTTAIDRVREGSTHDDEDDDDDDDDDDDVGDSDDEAEEEDDDDDDESGEDEEDDQQRGIENPESEQEQEGTGEASEDLDEFARLLEEELAAGG